MIFLVCVRQHSIGLCSSHCGKDVLEMTVYDMFTVEMKVQIFGQSRLVKAAVT